MELKYLAVSVVIAAVLMLGVAVPKGTNLDGQGIAAAYAQTGMTTGSENTQGGAASIGTHLAGSIANVQLGSGGQPEWIQSGIWVMRPLASTDTDHPAMQLIAMFSMVKTDGTSLHSHKVTNFKVATIMTEGNNTTVEGTATVTLMGNPISNVPLKVTVFNNSVIGIWIGPGKVNGHFGTSPLYGVISAASRERASGMGGQANVIKMSAEEVDEVYRWSSNDQTNPTLKLIANRNNVIQIQNPTDAKHELVFESNDVELASSGDITPDGSGQLTFRPTATGVIEYHCEYHPDTMKGTIEVVNPS